MTTDIYCNIKHITVFAPPVRASCVSWSLTFVDGHRLIRTGPYAIVRHPIYAGIGAAILGTAVAVGEVRALLAFLLIAAAYLHRIRIEERLLAREFGAEHDRYRRDVKALVPFLL